MLDTLFSKLQNPKGLKAAVLGAGVSGKSAALLLKEKGAKVTIFDSSPSVQEELSDPVEILTFETLFEEFDFIVLSPGIPREHGAVKKAILSKKPIVNEIDLAYSHLTNCRFIGVTGSNGKSTTTAMIGEVLKKCDPNAFVGGNYGRALCDVVLAAEAPRFGVLELSSYQLETLSLLKLDIALVTHLSPDHLDRYASVEDYYRAKNNIFALLKSGGSSIINQKDKNSKTFLQPKENIVEFNNPLPFRLENLVGAHNVENAAAAYSATLALGIDSDLIALTLSQFSGIPHRLEFLGSHRGVRWFNDSKATNVDASIVAVKSFADGVHLILGGKGKGSSYLPLVDACRGRVAKIYAIGEDAGAIYDSFQDEFAVAMCETLENAAMQAARHAVAGDVILLAPACASFDQFKNFGARGDHFRSLYQKEAAIHE